MEVYFFENNRKYKLDTEKLLGLYIKDVYSDEGVELLGLPNGKHEFVVMESDTIEELVQINCFGEFMFIRGWTTFYDSYSGEIITSHQLPLDDFLEYLIEPVGIRMKSARNI
jgi:hypothetical protein